MNTSYQKEPKKKKGLKPVFIVLIIIAGIISTVGIGLIGVVAFNADMSRSTEYIQAGEYDKAKEILDSQMETNPSQYKIYLIYSDLYLEQGKYVSAVDILNQGLSKCTQTDELQAKIKEITDKYSSEIAIEKEKIENEKREEEQRKQEEEQQKQEEQQREQQNQREQYISGCQHMSYADLARNPDKYKGQSFVFTGEIIQVIEPVWGNTVSLRINVTKEEYGYYTDTIYATVDLPEDADRLLEDDIITFYGDCDGLYTYKSVLGASISVPKIDIKYFNITQ